MYMYVICMLFKIIITYKGQSNALQGSIYYTSETSNSLPIGKFCVYNKDTVPHYTILIMVDVTIDASGIPSSTILLCRSESRIAL